MTTKTHLTELHKEHAQWLKDFAFYKDEIAIFKKRLSEVSAKNTDQGLKVLVSHFENQFKINENVMDELQHVVVVQEDSFRKLLESNPVAAEHRLVEDYADSRGQKKMFDKLYQELKSDYQKFLSKTM